MASAVSQRTDSKVRRDGMRTAHVLATVQPLRGDKNTIHVIKQKLSAAFYFPRFGQISSSQRVRHTMRAMTSATSRAT